jgi:2-phospho-L-lactate guanylyltransferase
MLADILDVLGKTSVDRVLVVSPDNEVLNFASKHGAVGLKEPGVKLNEALRLAIRHAMAKGAASVLIVPADVPALKTSDIEKILEMASSTREIIIAPSSTNGTNALLLRPPDVMDVHFGGESFPIHLARAREAGVKPKTYRSQTTAVDIDEVADLANIKSQAQGTRTYQFLQSLSKN